MNSRLSTELQNEGLKIRIGPFSVSVQSQLKTVLLGMEQLYRDYPSLDAQDFIDFHVAIKAPGGLRRWYHPQALFYFDGRQPFKPLPYSQAFAFFEWGLNWCFAQHSNQYLIFHAAVIARDNKAVILPAPPGSGKSTLCAGLIHRGWRLLSDELCMINPQTGLIHPVPRPVSLKNQSIDIIRNYDAAAEIGPIAHDTAKGTVAHLKVPHEMITLQEQTAMPTWVVLPKYVPEAAATLIDMDKGDMFMEVALNAFNYSVLGATAYDMTADLMDRCHCYRFSYSRLDDAVKVFDQLFEGKV
ncbi:MAG: HprK-related kinase A [Gammaproteobacteria bacterium]|nr:HprK-related kinase A [Gammaproteobacteria bacterium]